MTKITGQPGATAALTPAAIQLGRDLHAAGWVYDSITLQADDTTIRTMHQPATGRRIEAHIGADNVTTLTLTGLSLDQVAGAIRGAGLVTPATPGAGADADATYVIDFAAPVMHSQRPDMVAGLCDHAVAPSPLVDLLPSLRPIEIAAGRSGPLDADDIAPTLSAVDQWAGGPWPDPQPITGSPWGQRGATLAVAPAAVAVLEHFRRGLAEMTDAVLAEQAAEVATLPGGGIAVELRHLVDEEVEYRRAVRRTANGDRLPVAAGWWDEPVVLPPHCPGLAPVRDRGEMGGRP